MQGTITIFLYQLLSLNRSHEPFTFNTIKQKEKKSLTVINRNKKSDGVPNRSGSGLKKKVFYRKATSSPRFVALIMAQHKELTPQRGAWLHCPHEIAEVTASN